MICGICGAPYRVKTSFRDGIRWWRCGSGECGGRLKITDAGLERNVTALLNRLIAQPGLLDIQAVSAPLSLESEHLLSELYRELGKTDFSEARAVTLAFACAAKRYESLGGADCLKQKAAEIKKKLSLMKPLTAFDRELFCGAVNTVTAGADGALSLELISGAVISADTKIMKHNGEVKHNADTDATA